MKRTILQLSILFVVLVSFSTMAQPSSAVPTVFFNRDDNTALMTSFPNSQAKFNQFTATLNSFGVDNIESINSGPPTFGFNPNLSFGSTGITATTQGVLAQAAPTFSIGTQALLEQEGAGQATVNTVFSFNQPITAFGAFVIQGGDGTNNNLTTFRLRNTISSTSVDVPIQVGPGWGDNNVFFFGVTDTSPFNQVEILEALETPSTPGAVSDGMLYDNIVAGNVPEPGSLMLLVFGGAVALCRGARFRRG
jgi:hypothetical protein